MPYRHMHFCLTLRARRVESHLAALNIEVHLAKCVPCARQWHHGIGGISRCVWLLAREGKRPVMLACWPCPRFARAASLMAMASFGVARGAALSMADAWRGQSGAQDRATDIVAAVAATNRRGGNSSLAATTRGVCRPASGEKETGQKHRDTEKRPKSKKRLCPRPEFGAS